MIVIKLGGGLGNQLFQYAAGRCLSYQYHIPLKLELSQLDKNPYRSYELGAYNIQENFTTKEEAEEVNHYINDYCQTDIKGTFNRLRIKYFSTWSIMYEKHAMPYNPEVKHLSKPNIVLRGVWYSEKYFKEIETLIRQEFTLRYPLSEKDQQFARHMQCLQSASVHIRRTDFIGSRLDVCTPAYYQKAIDHVAKRLTKPYFFIFSDDPAWCRANLNLDYPSEIVSDESRSAAHELYLMSQCKHHIIANSSFSWWGAWLNPNQQKIVVAPDRWFAAETKRTAYVHDFIPPAWVRLEFEKENF